MKNEITFAENSSADILAKRITAELRNGTISPNLVTYWITDIMYEQDNKFLYKDHPDIEVKYDDLCRISDGITYQIVINELEEKQKESIKQMENTMNKPASEDLTPTRDMLAPTVIMDPVDPSATAETKEETTDTVEDPGAPSTVTPEVQTMANKQVKKPLTLANKSKANSQAGFAEVIALAVVVLVYVVIIVNLIIRLK